MNRSKLQILVVGMLVLTGCANGLGTFTNSKYDEIKNKEVSQRALNKKHVLRINRNGLIIDPNITFASTFKKAESRHLTRAKAHEHVTRLLNEAETTAIQRDIRNTNSKIVVKILVFVHGGLNVFDITDRRVKNFADRIQNEESLNDWHYPIFLSWPSNALGTWAESTFRIREGRKASLLTGLLTSPILIASELGQTVAKLPQTLYYQAFNDISMVTSDFDTTKELLGDQFSSARREAKRKLCRFIGSGAVDPKTRNKNSCNIDYKKMHQAHCNNSEQIKTEPCIKIRAGTYHQTLSNGTIRTVGHLVTMPSRYTAGALWHSGIASNAWNNMKRRTENIFYPPQLFGEGRGAGIGEATTKTVIDELCRSSLTADMDLMHGGEFFRELLCRVTDESKSKKFDYQITLVGHSMGAIVLDKTLTALRRHWVGTTALRNIVYMAAASSIEDSLGSVVPVLVCRQKNEHRPGFAQPCHAGQKEGIKTDFYNLMLNTKAEVSETFKGGIVPTGSLLISIDQHHENPEHPLRRTFGSEVNVLSSLDIIERRFEPAFGDVNFKAFDSAPNMAPGKHGDFGSIPFWRKSTWLPETTEYCVNVDDKWEAFNGYFPFTKNGNVDKTAMERLKIIKDFSKDKSCG